ncbi:MAG: hypothetical protein JSS64_08470 [Bacteroidetes bacterium]|nr:hypothetical protein [Bacteroidota bacterium]
MAETKIITRSVSTFTQPALEGNVDVVIHSAIAWIVTGVRVYINKAGVYEVISIAGSIYTLKLKTMEAAEGTTVAADILFPVQANTGAGKFVREW